MIDVTPGDRYRVTGWWQQSGRAYYFFDSDGNYISGSRRPESVGRNPGEAYTGDITVPEGVARIGINEYASNADVTFIGTLAGSAETGENTGNLLTGKTLCCVGDSITFGEDMQPEKGYDDAGTVAAPGIEMYQWHNNTQTWDKVTGGTLLSYGYQIAQKNGMVFYNGGVSSSTLQDVSLSDTPSEAIKNAGFSKDGGRYTKLPDNIDYLTIWFGWNDSGHSNWGTNVGEITDTDPQTSFYGAWNTIMPYLQNKYPHTKIVLCVPYLPDMSKPNERKQGYRDAVRKIAGKYGVTCFDMYGYGTPLYYGKEPGIDVDADDVAANQKKYQANGAHPNHFGHAEIARRLEECLRSISA